MGLRRVLERGVLAVAVFALVSAPAWLDRPRRDQPGSYSDGVGVTIDGARVLLPAASAASFVPGTRVIVDPDADSGSGSDAVSQHRAWLAQGWLPDDHAYRDLVADALLDLHVLTGDGATIAALNRYWDFVWPRDAAFAAVAFAATGHLQEAVANLRFLQEVQHADGSFEARYLPDGSGPPDDRGRQTDGTGWALWALASVVDEASPAERAGLIEQFRPLLDSSTRFLLAEVDGSPALPAPSSDYWEHRERVVTIGTAAPVLAGLEASATLYEVAGSPDLAARSAAAATSSREAIVEVFGPHGYPRYPGRSHADSAVAFLLPPYQDEPLPGAVQAWRDSVPTMLRPAGGIAPGGGWTELNLSWTPETAMYALAAASIGDEAQARRWLDFLAEHRTPTGALPEKVGADGAPAGPAPLAWTCALVVLTVLTLESD